MKIAIINGPNLNLLGVREPGIYGHTSFEDYYGQMVSRYPEMCFSYFQSNVEGEVISRLHEVGFDTDGIVLNAGAYSHTSLAIADAVAAIKAPVVEVHISNVFARESVRHKSMVAPYCLGAIAGFGLYSYDLAVLAIRNALL